jgi:4'-phosphopantetheinyl transferase
MILKIQSENYLASKSYESENYGINIMENPALFIIKTGDFPESEIQRLWSSLNTWERTKSQRFNREKERVSYILVHGLLRNLLNNFLGIPPEGIKFRYNQFGKPFVTGAGKKIFFNMSHSSDISVLGFDPDSEIGVDVEKINQNVDYEVIARHFFTQNEISYIYHEKGNAIRRFYEIWTRKEALLKALGIGITENLNIEVSIRNDFRMKNLVHRGSNNGIFHLKTMTFQDEYILSIASNKDSRKISTFSIWK